MQVWMYGRCRCCSSRWALRLTLVGKPDLWTAHTHAEFVFTPSPHNTHTGMAWARSAADRRNATGCD
eukprot:357723-Chlamydomonas_euryale.AAC.22